MLVQAYWVLKHKYSSACKHASMHLVASIVFWSDCSTCASAAAAHWLSSNYSCSRALCCCCNAANCMACWSTHTWTLLPGTHNHPGARLPAGHARTLLVCSKTFSRLLLLPLTRLRQASCWARTLLVVHTHSLTPAASAYPPASGFLLGTRCDIAVMLPPVLHPCSQTHAHMLLLALPPPCASGFLLGTRQTLLETFDGGNTWQQREIEAARDEGFNYRWGGCMGIKLCTRM